MSLRNRVALVTGGSRGIGRGIATRLGQNGARVAIAYRSNKAAAQQTLRQIQAVGVECVAVETDISDPARAEQLVKTVVERFGRLDIVVNNVGDFRWGTVSESSLEDWQGIFSSNLLTALYVCRAVLPHMRKGRWGRIINLGAVGAERAFGQAKISAYAAAKAAVVALSRSLALEEAKNGITVKARSMRDARFPIGRPPTVEDVAATVAFFASEEAEYVTGQVMNVSGGWML
jgi:3-oxoacyl-[acyl-carrier protein] reductase